MAIITYFTFAIYLDSKRKLKMILDSTYHNYENKFMGKFSGIQLVY